MKRIVAHLVALAAFALLAASGSALAAGESAPAERKMTMTEAVTAADFQQIEGGPLLFAAYAVVWAVFFGAVVFLFWRMRKVAAEVRRLEARIREVEAPK
jgi:CcmD family protein